MPCAGEIRGSLLRTQAVAGLTGGRTESLAAVLCFRRLRAPTVQVTDAQTGEVRQAQTLVRRS